MTKIIICGANGKMGQVLADAAARSSNMYVSAGIDKFPESIQNDFTVYDDINDCKDKADVIIDFSRPEALEANLSYAKQTGMSIVIATTGFSDNEKKIIEDASKSIPVFFAANMSLGVNLQMELAKKSAEFLGEAYDIEIIEKHHNQKVDSPSGTALAIADCINEAYYDKKEYIYGRHTKIQKRGREICMHAVRGGTITGEHSVQFIGTDEIIEINHIAQSKQIFAFGALRAASFLIGKSAGLYNMNDLISEIAITNIYKDDGQAMVTMTDIPFSPSMIANIFTKITNNNIKVDIISQTAPHNGIVSLSFSMPHTDMEKCIKALEEFEKDGAKIITNDSLSKLTVEGAGMQRQSGVAAKLFEALAKKDIGIYIITTSETKICFCVDALIAQDAIDVVSSAFSL